MTEEKRRNEEERRQQKWVELRAACTEQGVFDQIADVVERDVVRFNNLPPQERKDRKFKCDRIEQASVYVAEVNASGEWIKDFPGINIQKGSTNIRVWRNQRCQFTVEPEWNEATLTCDLKIDGECHSVWKISQKAIGDLLFRHD